MNDPMHADALLQAVLRIPPGVLAIDHPIGFEPPGDPATIARPTYVIAMTARSGSTALRHHLAQSGVLGDPRECLNPRGFIGNHLNRLSDPSIWGLLGYARAKTATDNGCFGITATFWDLCPLIANGLFQDIFAETRFIHLTRRDLLAQAISLHIARTSGHWHTRADGTQVGRDERSPVAFDADAIARLMSGTALQDANWRSLFAATGVEPLAVVYEDLVGAMPEAVSRIAAHLGIELPAAPASADGFVPTQSGLKQEFHRRFRAACNAPRPGRLRRRD